MIGRGRFHTDITADERGAVAAFTRTGDAVRRIDQDLDRADRRARGLSETARTVGAALLAAFSIRAIGDWVSDAVSAADAIDKLSKSTGLSVETIQEMTFAGEQLGVKADFLTKGFERFNKRLGELVATGTAPGAKGFEALGLKADFVSGKLGTTEEALEAAIERLADYETSGERAAIAAQLFGDDAGPGMAKLLAEGVEGLEFWRERAATLTQEQIDDAVRVNDAWNELVTNMTVTWRGFILDTVSGWSDMIAVITGDEMAMPIGELQLQTAEIEQQLNRLLQLRRAASEGDLNFLDRRSLASLEGDEADLRAEHERLQGIIESRRAFERLKSDLADDGGAGGGSRLSGGGGSKGKTLAEQEAEAAAKAGEALDKLILKHDEWISQKQFEAELVGLEDAEAAKRQIMRDAEANHVERMGLAIDALRDENADYLAMLEEVRDEEVAVATALYEREAAHDAAADAADRDAAATERMSSSLSSMFSTIRSGSDALFALGSLGIEGLFGEGAFGGVINNALGVEGGGIIGALFNADGNAFGPGGVTPFAAGGVVDRATMFSYGGGRLGVMGEAGPEAILPLSRGADGRLGVASGGGGGAVNVKVETYTQNPVEVREERNGPDVTIIVEEIVANGIGRPGSRIERALSTRGR